jgi:hypothetical protein
MQIIIILNFKMCNVGIVPAKLLEHFFRAAIFCSQNMTIHETILEEEPHNNEVSSRVPSYSQVL